MTNVVKGFGAGSSNGGGNGGTSFVSMYPPPGDILKDYDKTLHYTQQKVQYPQAFNDIMSVREEVYGEQGIPLEDQFDDDDARSWHWIIYASVATTSSPSPPSLRPTRSGDRAEEERRSSATAQSLAVGTVRLVPPPHGPNKHNEQHQQPTEPFIKFDNLVIRKEFREMGSSLSNIMIDEALKFAAHKPDTIRPPPRPTTMELANQLGTAAQEVVATWEGLAKVHAPTDSLKAWETFGFTKQLRNESGKVEIAAEKPWTEGGIEYIVLWKRIKLDAGRL